MRSLFDPLPEASKYRDSGATQPELQCFFLERFCIRNLSDRGPTNSWTRQLRALDVPYRFHPPEETRMQGKNIKIRSSNGGEFDCYMMPASVQAYHQESRHFSMGRALSILETLRT